MYKVEIKVDIDEIAEVVNDFDTKSWIMLVNDLDENSVEKLILALIEDMHKNNSKYENVSTNMEDDEKEIIYNTLQINY